VVAELVEALDHPRAAEALLDEQARPAGRELGVAAVDRRPVVHRVDDDPPREEVGIERAETMPGNGEDDQVSVADDLLGRRGTGARGEDLDRQRDVAGRAGPR
jgi:hypothetical protein